jgi:hypothetical protein
MVSFGINCDSELLHYRSSCTGCRTRIQSTRNGQATCRFYLLESFLGSATLGESGNHSGPVSLFKVLIVPSTFTQCDYRAVSSGYTNYLQNVQHVLQLGRAIVDIGIYHGATEGVKGGLKDTSLTEAGYTYGFPSDGLLARADAVVRDGKLWNEGPGYKVTYREMTTIGRER